jgi:hypothetical protein
MKPSRFMSAIASASSFYTGEPTKGSAVQMMLQDRLWVEHGLYPQRSAPRGAHQIWQSICVPLPGWLRLRFLEREACYFIEVRTVAYPTVAHSVICIITVTHGVLSPSLSRQLLDTSNIIMLRYLLAVVVFIGAAQGLFHFMRL